MKKSLVALIILSLVLAGCAVPLHVGGKVYPTYGLFNESTDRSKEVCYKVSAGNIVWSIILVETIVAPIYFIGFDLFEPIRMKKNASDDCSFDAK